MGGMDIKEWYGAATKGASDSTVGHRTGINQATLWRQKREGTFSPENLVRIARAYGRPALEPLLVIGLVTQNDVDRSARVARLHDASDGDLVAELGSRLGVAVEPETAAGPGNGRVRRTFIDSDGNSFEVELDPMTLAARRGDPEWEAEEFEEQP